MGVRDQDGGGGPTATRQHSADAVHSQPAQAPHFTLSEAATLSGVKGEVEGAAAAPALGVWSGASHRNWGMPGPLFAFLPPPVKTLKPLELSGVHGRKQTGTASYSTLTEPGHGPQLRKTLPGWKEAESIHYGKVGFCPHHKTLVRPA